MMDLTADAHVYSAFGTGRDSIAELVAAAERAGLAAITIADPAGAFDTWMPAYLAGIHRAQQRTDVLLRPAIEVEPLEADGWLNLPLDLGGLELVSVVVRRLQLPGGVADADQLRQLLRRGAVTPTEIVERLVAVTSLAIERSSRYAPTHLAQPFGLLDAAGVAPEAVGAGAVAALVSACQVTRTAVEVSERHQTPSLRIAQTFAGAGVTLVAASDAHRAADVGRWEYVRQVQERLAAGLSA